MKLDRLFVFKAINIAVVLACVIICVAASSEAGKHFDGDVFYIAPVINDNRFYFSIDELEAMASEVEADKFAFMSVDSSIVSVGDYQVFSRVVHTNSEYFQLNHMQFAQGGGWQAQGEGENVAVVNESLAWQLFGSVSVVGNKLSFHGEDFVIVGVIRQESVSRDDGSVYMPMNPEPGGRIISSAFLKLSGSRLSAYSALGEAFWVIGKAIRAYHVTDVDSFVDNIGLKYKLLVFFIGAYAAAVIVINSYRFIMSGQYTRKKIITLAVLLLLDAVIIALLVRGITFDVWIPHGDGSRADDIIRTLTNSGLLPSEDYLSDGLRIVARQSAYANAAFIAGAVALVNFVFVHRKPPQANMATGVSVGGD